MLLFSLRAQIVTTVPSSVIPKRLPCFKRKKEEPPEDINEVIDLEEAEEAAEELPPLPTEDDIARNGQILWIRGLSRLQTQVKLTPRTEPICLPF